MRAIRLALALCGFAAWTSVAACGSTSTGQALTGSPDAATDAPTVMGDDDGGGSTDASDAAAMYPAFKPGDVPQVANLGGPVMKSPKIVPIVFSDMDDAMTVASLEDFVAKVGTTHYWGALSEYGVGAAMGATPVALQGANDPPATWDDSDIQTFVANKIADGTLPAPDANTIYTLFTPPGVTVTMTYSFGGGGGGDGGVADGGDAGSNTVVAKSCVDFGGYHDNIDYGPDGGTQPVAYAVVPRCANFGQLLTGLDAITGPASHELAEAATDPFPSTNPAFATVDRPHAYWSRLLGGGEIGDMCAQNPQSFTKFTELPYTVQRIWSNAAPKNGADPCVPVPGSEVYFNSYPVVNDTITLSFHGQTIMMKGVKIPVGSSKQVEVDLASSGPTSGPWTVEARDQSQLAGSTTPTYLDIAFDKPSGQNGDKLMMTINVKAAGRGNIEPFLVISKIGTGSTEQLNFWAGVVGN